MTDQDQPGTASPGTQDALHTEDDSLSAEDAVALLAQAPETNPLDDAGNQDAEQNPEEENLETVAGLDLNSLSENEWQGIADHLNSRGADRIAGLIKERSELRQALDAKSTQEEEDPLARPPEPEDNPYHEIETVEDLQAKAAEVDDMIEWADNLIEENEDTHSDSVVHEEDGKEYTLREIKSLRRNARKARTIHLKNRYHELQGLQQVEAQRQQARQLAEDEFAWMKEDGNPIRERYEGLMAHPGLVALKEQFPELGLVLAHAADSIHRSEQRKQGNAPGATKQTQGRRVPPENPGSGTAAPARQAPAAPARLESLAKQFDSTGDHKVLEEILALNSN